MTTATPTPQVDVRRAEERFKTRLGWLDSKHSFSFSRHYDRANTHHGLLLVNNDDIVNPGTGGGVRPQRERSGVLDRGDLEGERDRDRVGYAHDHQVAGDPWLMTCHVTCMTRH